jgi:glycosyltransferase involved in cell wall biosynthesis
VPDIRPYVAPASVYVCPLRWGTGVKNKVLAALAMGKAVVATPQSIEGLDLRPGIDLLIASDPADFAARVTHLIANPRDAARLGAAGRETVSRKYSWTSSGIALEQTFQDLVAQRPVALAGV